MQYSKTLVKTLSLSLLVSGFSASASDNSKLVRGLKLGGVLAGAGLAVASLCKLNALRTESPEERLARLLSEDAVKLAAPVAFVGSDEEAAKLNAEIATEWQKRLCNLQKAAPVENPKDGAIDVAKTREQFVKNAHMLRTQLVAQHQDGYRVKRSESFSGFLRTKTSLTPQEFANTESLFQEAWPAVDADGRLSIVAVMEMRKWQREEALVFSRESHTRESERKEQAALSQELRRAVSEANKQREAASSLLSTHYQELRQNQEELRQAVVEATKKEQAAPCSLLPLEIARAGDVQVVSLSDPSPASAAASFPSPAA